MSSTNKTPILNMHSWVRTDPVVCEDFNENFSKIDAAIGEARANYGGGEIYAGAYTGTGTSVYSLTFPKPPVFIILSRTDMNTYYSCFVRSGLKLHVLNTNTTLSVSENTITFTNADPDDPGFNRVGLTHTYIAFALAKQ